MWHHIVAANGGIATPVGETQLKVEIGGLVQERRRLETPNSKKCVQTRAVQRQGRQRPTRPRSPPWWVYTNAAKSRCLTCSPLLMLRRSMRYVRQRCEPPLASFMLPNQATSFLLLTVRFGFLRRSATFIESLSYARGINEAGISHPCSYPQPYRVE